jgi:predicted glycosyltransferase
MRRNLLIAQALAKHPLQPVIMLITGAREVCAFEFPHGVDCITLPSLLKADNGEYRARRWEMTLNELVGLRSKAVAAALKTFAPDLLIVDKVPRGAVGELEESLRLLRADGLTRCVLGIRDVLDDPATVRREWAEADNEEAIGSYYDAVWVYGDRRVYDPVKEYQFSAQVASRVTFTGYLAKPEPADLAQLEDHELFPFSEVAPSRLVLCLVGGGQDGSPLAEAFSEVDFPPDMTGVVMTGPFMPSEVRLRLCRRAKENPRLKVLPFVTDSDLLLRQADRVVAMGGYNTVCEVLSCRKPALIVPRVQPRREQLIRAERLQELGLLELLHPDDLSPRALTDWLVGNPLFPGLQQSPLHDRIDLNGLANLPRLLEEVLEGPPPSNHGQGLKRRKQYVRR